MLIYLKILVLGALLLEYCQISIFLHSFLVTLPFLPPLSHIIAEALLTFHTCTNLPPSSISNNENHRKSLLIFWNYRRIVSAQGAKRALWWNPFKTFSGNIQNLDQSTT